MRQRSGLRSKARIAYIVLKNDAVSSPLFANALLRACFRFAIDAVCCASSIVRAWGKRRQALSVVATEHSVDVLCGVPVVEFAGHVVEGVLDEREVDGVEVEVGAFG